MSGVIDDTRKLLQDLVTPDLKALQMQVAAIEKLIDARFAALDSRFTAIDTRFTATDGRFTAVENAIGAGKDVVLGRIATLEAKVDSNHAQVLNALGLDKRIERIESALGGVSLRGEPFERPVRTNRRLYSEEPALEAGYSDEPAQAEGA